MGPWLATKLALHENPKIPRDFPNDVPVYPNFQLEEVQKYAGAQMLELTAKSDAQTVLAFYQQHGFGITATKEGRAVGLVVTPLKDGQSVVRQMVR